MKCFEKQKALSSGYKHSGIRIQRRENSSEEPEKGFSKEVAIQSLLEGEGVSKPEERKVGHTLLLVWMVAMIQGCWEG